MTRDQLRQALDQMIEAVSDARTEFGLVCYQEGYDEGFACTAARFAELRPQIEAVIAEWWAQLEAPDCFEAVYREGVKRW